MFSTGGYFKNLYKQALDSSFSKTKNKKIFFYLNYF